MFYFISLAQAVSLANFLNLIPYGKTETALGNVSDLRMGMAVQRANSAFLKFVYHTHQLAAVG
jgi:hypothetical protein